VSSTSCHGVNRSDNGSTSAPTPHASRQRLVLQGFSDPQNPKTLSKIGIPLAPHYASPHRSPGFMPSASSLAFHPVSSPRHAAISCRPNEDKTIYQGADARIQVEMVVACGGYDSSGMVKLFRCPTPRADNLNWEHVNGSGAH
jgi:regulator-associated protein of mTOR